MAYPSSSYNFATLDNHGLRKQFSSPPYSRLNREVVAQQQFRHDLSSHYSQESPSIDSFRPHSGLENGYISNSVPGLHVRSRKDEILNHRRHAPFALGSPLKPYTDKLYSTQQVEPVPFIASNIQQHQSFYPSPQVSTASQIQKKFQVKASTETTTPESAIHQPHSEALVDVFSNMPQDQCYYCVSDIGGKPFKADAYLNTEWIADREKFQKERTKHTKEEIREKFDRKEWEQEIVEKMYSTNKIKQTEEELDFDTDSVDYIDNISQEGEVTTFPEGYLMMTKNPGLDSSLLDSEMSNSMRKAQIQIGSIMKASLFAKKLQNKAEERRLLNQKKEIQDKMELSDAYFEQYDEIQRRRVKYANEDEDQRRRLDLFKYMNSSHNSMQKDESRIEISFEELKKFIRAQMQGINDTIIVNGLGRIEKSLQSQDSK